MNKSDNERLKDELATIIAEIRIKGITYTLGIRHDDIIRTIETRNQTSSDNWKYIPF